ncbi:serine hydrolase domain-containing protein [Pseudoalteromonas obscura]|uniref:Serine hydrolase domain-containing protein n=1 Tax=Pseudoalteromonas obscura TaxID=3048491 RepID=A0ABT7EFB5_9GAMM|nr:serine hydrolase domain-containing protein [Pseudoalteromonas sp. P94(2023)]MDK2593983.1 serine hydrolase domain-containing protein [Pseudoalteromonas sp. P94(2023)]
MKNIITTLQLLITLCVVVTSSLSSVYAASNNDVVSGIDQKLEQVLAEQQLDGIIWTMVDGGRNVTGARGVSDAQSKNAMTDLHKMYVGSVTKAVLAVGVLRLITEQKLSLDTSVSQVLPGIEINNPWSKTHPITVRHLLTHTSGLDDIRMHQLLTTQTDPNMPLELAFRDSSTLDVRNQPGRRFSYSNIGFTLLGMVIEKVTAVRYEDYLLNHILRPLEMHQSSFHFVAENDLLLAMGHYENQVKQTPVSTVLRPAGQFVTTAPDMAKFLQFLMTQDHDTKSNFIAPQLLDLMSTPQGTESVKHGLKIGQGLVLSGRDRHDVLGACRPGSAYGYNAYLCIFPEQNKAYFWAVNTDNESANLDKLNQLFIEQLDLEPAELVEPNAPAIQTPEIEGVYVLAPNKMVHFALPDLLFHSVYLSQNEGQLTIQSLQTKDRVLLPIGDGIYRDITRRTPSHAIYEARGKQYLTDGFKTYSKISIVEFTFYWISLSIGLLSFVYLMAVGLYKLIRLKTSQNRVLVLPVINFIAFAVPIYLLGQQHYLQLGDKTLASLSLFVCSALLPLSVLTAAVLLIRQRTFKEIKYHLIALVMFFQWYCVMFYWDFMPIALWKI